jgi:peroxiredoxin
MVFPGRYRFGEPLIQDKKIVGELTREAFVVSDEQEGPLDIGDVIVRPVTALRVGDNAPEFKAEALDGQHLALSDFRGRFVLLNFSASWCSYCVAEVPHLLDAYDACGTNDRFTMITLSLDHDREELSQFVGSGRIKWLQVHLDASSRQAVTTSYGVRGIPSVFLISPDGKVVALDLRGAKIKSTVETALGVGPSGSIPESATEGGLKCAL